MKKIISLGLFAFMLFGIFFSCAKEKSQINNGAIHDTIYIVDSIYTVDTLFIIDTIIFSDTVVLIDTIIVYDTSEFDYLFKHHDLGLYDLLFYTLDKQKTPYRICNMNSNAHDIRIIDEGYKAYPVWAEEDGFIYYVNFETYTIVKRDIRENPIADIDIVTIDRNVQFLWNDVYLEMFLFSYHSGDEIKIAAIDYKTGEIIELTEMGRIESNPVSSRVDDWIYYSSLNNDSWDIYRKKIDASNVELVYADPVFNLQTFNVSADGKFLITPKFRDGKGFIVFYDIKRHSIIRELELPIDGHPLYASLSNDNKAVFFVNGTPYDYTKPRNIYRMALDRTQLFQLTQFEDLLASRPLIK